MYNSLKFLDRNYDASGYDDSMLDDDDANADQESANVDSPVMSMVRKLAPDSNKLGGPNLYFFSKNISRHLALGQFVTTHLK